MSTTDTSTEDEITGSIVNVIHVDDSGTDPTRTVLALATKDDLGITIDESTESFDPANVRRTQRYRTNNQIDIEVSSAVSTDLADLQLIGLVDDSGAIDFSEEARDLGTDQYIEIGYSDAELDYSTDPGPADFELLHRASDVEIMAGDIDPSGTPPTVSFTAMVHGDLVFAAETLGA